MQAPDGRMTRVGVSGMFLPPSFCLVARFMCLFVCACVVVYQEVKKAHGSAGEEVPLLSYNVEVCFFQHLL